MKYKKIDNKIIIQDLSQFNINQILDCGQIFRYYINENMAEVVSADKYAQIYTSDNTVEIVSSDIDYFEHFFDIKRDYNSIKQDLEDDTFLAPAIEYGYGIRILNQDLFEMIVSFIVSANNNIRRIKNSLNYLSRKFGSLKQCEGIILKKSPISTKSNNGLQYYAFPTLEQLKTATIQDYTDAGLGYRAEYMYNTIQKLSQKDLDYCKVLDSASQRDWLMSLNGIGEKVAHCIMLFALRQTSVFPVDTWINKVYNDLTGEINTNRRLISSKLSEKYKDLSGYAQQYFFYYYRSR